MHGDGLEEPQAFGAAVLQILEREQRRQMRGVRLQDIGLRRA